MKICGTCEEEKELKCFYFRNGKPRSYCKECSNKKSKAYHTKNRDKVLAKKKETYLSNRVDILEKQREYYEENKEPKLTYQREYNLKNSEVLSEKRRARYAKNPVKELTSNKLYRESEKGKEVRRICHQRRRARLKEAEGSFVLSEWEDALSYFGNQCSYCGCEYELQMDHFIPISNGGKHSKCNIVPACISCNASKKALDPEEWYKGKTFFSQERLDNINAYLHI